MLCNYLQNVVATTYIFRLQLSTFIFYNKQPLERFRDKGAVCKSCYSTYTSELNGFGITEENAVKIERIYKEPIPERTLDTKQAGIELVSPDECFVQLINYKKAWISNYGRPLEYCNGKYVIKRTKELDRIKVVFKGLVG